MKRALTAVAALCALCLLLCSCTLQPIQPVEELMHPPYNSDNNQDLLAAFHASVEGTPAFLSPLGGDYCSAIVMQDFDGDGEEEALIFYKIKLGSDTARVNLLDNAEGRWRSVADFKGAGTAVDSLCFAQMDADKGKELIVCWRVGTTAGRVFSVFRKGESDASFKELSAVAYAVMKVADIDKDGFDDIFYISQETVPSGNRNTAVLLKLSNEKSDGAQLVELGSAKLDSNVVSYNSLQSSATAAQGNASLFADAVKGEDSMITEVIRWNGKTGELEVPFLDKTTMSNTATLRTPLIPCTDIDDDGVIEIPTQHPLSSASLQKNGEKNETAQGIMITEWMEEKNGKLISKATTVINPSLSYIYTFRQEDIGKIFIREETEDCWIFYRRDAENGKTEDLFSVIPVDKADWNEQNNERYTVLADCGSHYICAYISDAGNHAAINTGELEEQFRVFTL